MKILAICGITDNVQVNIFKKMFANFMTGRIVKKMMKNR